MKSKSIYLLLLLSIILVNCSKSDQDILKQATKKLQDLKFIKYKYESKNYSINGELGQNDSLTAIINFTGNDSILDGVKYYFLRNHGDVGYNGLSTFYTNREKKYLVYNLVRSKEDLYGLQYRFTIEQLRDLLPQMINDSAITFHRMADTIIDNTACFAFDILMHEKGIDIFENIVQRKNSVRNYNLFLDKKDLFPKQFIVFFEHHLPIWVVTYRDITLSKSVNDSIFDYSYKKPDYKRYTQEEFQLVSKNEDILKENSYLGVKALDWTLPSMSGDSVTLSKIDTNLVLLDFWFPFCTGCVSAIPEINKIQKEFKDKGLKVYGIEFTKEDSTRLTNYVKKMKIEYPTLYSAKKVAAKYGVSVGPTVFLIKNGEFIYARAGFIKDEVLNEIEKNLK